MLLEMGADQLRMVLQRPLLGLGWAGWGRAGESCLEVCEMPATKGQAGAAAPGGLGSCSAVELRSLFSLLF